MPFLSKANVDSAEAPAANEDSESSVSVIVELRRLFAHFPDGLGAFDQMYQRMVGKGRLEPTMRLVILGAAARWRRDPFIASVMFGQAIERGLSPETVGRWIDAAEGADPSGAEPTLLAFCRKATQSAFTMVQYDVDALHAQEWTIAEIVEAVTMVGLSGYMTVMCAAGGLLHNPELEPEPWR